MDFVQTYSDEEQSSKVKLKAYIPTLILEEKILQLEDKLKVLQSKNEMLKSQFSETNIVSSRVSVDFENIGSETESNNSSTKAFIRLSTEKNLNSVVSNLTFSYFNREDCFSSQFEYHSEDESDFEGDVKKEMKMYFL